MHDRCLGTVGLMAGIWAVPTEFAWSFGRLCDFNAQYLCQAGETIHYARAKASDHALARNGLADEMRGDWLLMLDTDHAFEPDLCQRMAHRMTVHGLDVLTGVYTFKGAPHAPVLYVNEGDGPRVLGKWEGSDLIQVHAAGAGCLMVRRAVFDRIRDELDEAPFSHRGAFSEDLSFFERLRELDIAVWADMRIQSHHLVPRELSLSDFDVTQYTLSERVPVRALSLEVS